MGCHAHGESALTLYIPARRAIVRIFDIAVANCTASRERDRQSNLVVAQAKSSGKMMLIGLVLFAAWARTAVSELRKFIRPRYQFNYLLIEQ